jgi:outer membrane protein OmpA-like peptidoglycan-associated protein
MPSITLPPRAPLLGVTLAVLLSLSGCANMNEGQQRTTQGAAVGAVAGAVLSSATGGKAGTGALIGGALGAIGGNIWSQRMQEKQRAMERAAEGTGVAVTRTPDNQLKVDVPADISFELGSAALQPRLRPVLESFAQGLAQDRASRVRIVGHTDSTGSDAINEPLSLQRAESVRLFLVDRGIGADRIEAFGRGSREPLASNATPEDRARNRRVEIFLREPEAAS